VRHSGRRSAVDRDAQDEALIAKFAQIQGETRFIRAFDSQATVQLGWISGMHIIYRLISSALKGCRPLFEELGEKQTRPHTPDFGP